MKILEVSYKDPESHSGGVEDFVLNLMNKLSEAGHAVTCLYSQESFKGDLNSKFMKLGIFNIRKPNNAILSLLHKILYNFAVLLYAIENHKRFDVIHVNGDNGVFLPIFFSKKTVSTFFGLPFLRVRNTIGNHFSIENYLRIVLAKISTLLHAPSLLLSKIVVAENPIIYKVLKFLRKEVNVKLVYNAVDTEAFKPASSLEKEVLRKELGIVDNRLHAIWIGNDAMGYGLDIAVSIADKFEQGILLVVIGAKSGQMHSNVREVGRVGHELLAKYIRASDFMLFPQRYPGISLSMVSCMLSGLKVVAFSKHISEFFSGLNVLFADNKSQMEKIVSQLIKNPKFLVVNEFDPVLKRFSPDYCATEYIELYRRV